MSESSTPVPESIPEPLLSECRAFVEAGKPIQAVQLVRKTYDLQLVEAVRLLESSLGWKLGTRLEPQADGSVVVRGPTTTPTPLRAGRYFSWTHHTFGRYQPSYGDSMGEVVGYFEGENGHTYSMTNADARTQLTPTFRAHDTVLNTTVDVVSVYGDESSVVVLPPGWTPRLLDDPNFRLDASEQIARLKPLDGVAWTIHGVALDDPGLADAVMHTANGNDEAAVEDIARRYRLSTVEADQVLHALLGDGPRPAGCFLDVRGRLKLMAAGSELAEEIRQIRCEVVSDPHSPLFVHNPDAPVFMGRNGVAYTLAGVSKDRATGYEIELRIPPGGFTVPDAPARPTVEVFDDPRPDWLPEGWTSRFGHYHGPDGEQVFTHGHGHACAWGSKHPDIEAWTEWTEHDKRALVLALAYPDRVLNPPTFAGLAQLKADGFLQELNRLVLHPAGRALGFTLDDSGRVMDVWVNPTSDPAGWGFVPAEDDAEFQANAANVAREIEAHRRARLADPDLGSVVEFVPGEGPRWETVARDPDEYDLLNTVLSNLGLYETYEARLLTLLGKSADPEADAAIRVIRAAMVGVTEDYTTIRTRAESFLLSDDFAEPTPYELGAHEAAMTILRGDGDQPDPRVTMRGEIEQRDIAIAGLMELLGQRVVADGERSIAQMSACAYLSQQIEAHPGALNFLEDGWTWVDDSGTPRSYVATVQRIEGQTPGQMITGLKAENARLQAILDAETGRKGLPGWAYRVPLDEGLPYWEMYTKDARGAASVKIGGRLVVIFGSGMKATRVEGAVNALHGMELAEAELRRFGLMAPE